MIAKLQSPLVGAVAGIVLGIGMGVFSGARALMPLLERSLAPAQAKAPQELKERGWDFWTIEIDNLSNALKEERAKLRKQTELLDQRSARVAAEEKELSKVRAEIEKLRGEIAKQVVEIGADEAKNIRMLAQTYSTLTPRAVVGIFKEMDDTTVVKVLSLMKAESVGPIFEEMSKTSGSDSISAKRVAVLSEKLRLMKASKPSTST